ncbi:hypothetical protein BJ978_001169 [Agromyces terreus]|uniref:Uncharacterized protein n=1 Tax=Agromyces terreus TaxID=424795 RepID=A0A9X2KAM5_9MICO|nr:hypothetical protein [Agromyces terreus]MCP2370493.1 hypothetical protein [Agromyces terreus]
MSDASAPLGDAARDPHVLGPGLLPTPFTADEIRAATGEGKTIVLLVEAPDGSRFERVNRFGDCDAEGATLEQWRLDAAGGIDGEATSERVAWRELQEHASFPAESTRRTTVTIETPLGRIECLRYEVGAAAGESDADEPVATFWFSPEHPGMPVRYEIPTPAGTMRTTAIAIER